MANDLYTQGEQPHDLDTERAVIATLMRYNELYETYSVKLHEDLFYYEQERAMFKAVVGVLELGQMTDVNSLAAYARSHDLGYSVSRADFVSVFQLASTRTFDQDIERLAGYERRRKCWLALQQAAKNVLDPMTKIDSEIADIISTLTTIQASMEDSGISSFGDAIADLEQIVAANANGKHVFLHTGFRLFDEYFLLRPTTLTVIAAFTSVGKTALAMNISVNVAKEGNAVAYYSLEMGKAELASRVISKEAQIPASVLMNKPLAEFQKSDFAYAAANNRNLPIYIDENSTISFDSTINSIRTMVKSKGVKLAVIDYLQIYTQVSENVEASLASMARGAKNIAKECGIAVILLSQLNRSDSHPSIKMLRGSGQIEESADNIVLIDRPDAYPDNKVKKYIGEFEDEPVTNTAKLILEKGRGVGTGCALVGFDGSFTRFYERDDNTAISEQPF